MSTRPSSFEGVPRWKARVAVVALQQLLAGAGLAVYSLLPKFLLTVRLASEDDVGIVAAGIPTGALLAAPMLSRLFGRLPLVRILQLGLVVFTLTAAVFVPLSSSAGVPLLPFSLVFGASMVMVFNTAGAITAELVPRRHMARAVGLHGAANMIGFALSPALIEVIAARAGWTSAFSIAVAMGLCALAVSVLVEEPPRPPPTASAAGQGVGRRIAAVAIASMACGIAHFALYVFHQPHVFALGGTQVRDYFIGFTSGALLMRIGFGGLADTYGHARVALLSLGAYALVVGGAVFMTPATLGLFGFAQGVVHGIFYPALVALGVGLAGDEAKARAINWLYAIFNLGSMMSGIALGALAERLDTRAAFAAAGFAATIGVFALLPSATAERRARQGGAAR